MPVFFFDIEEEGKASSDVFGIELANLYEARDQALSLLPDLARDHAVDEEHRTVTAIVRCQEGRMRYRITLTITGEWIEEPEYPKSVED